MKKISSSSRRQAPRKAKPNRQSRDLPGLIAAIAAMKHNLTYLSAEAERLGSNAAAHMMDCAAFALDETIARHSGGTR